MSRHMADVPDIKLIRTDTTLDLSHSAEKRWRFKASLRDAHAFLSYLWCSGARVTRARGRARVRGRGRGRGRGRVETRVNVFFFTVVNPFLIAYCIHGFEREKQVTRKSPLVHKYDEFQK